MQQFLPVEFHDFVKLKLLNDSEEPLKTWYYLDENLALVLDVNWGFKRQQISIDVDIESFTITIVDDKENITRNVDYLMLNDFLISFITLQSRNLSQIFESITDKKKAKKKNGTV